MDLGRPIGQNTTAPAHGFDQGEHGAGTGLSGGHGVATSANTQAGKFAETERSGFNAGLGGEHASGGLPSHGTAGEGHHPIADKYMSGGVYGSGSDNAGAGVGSGLGSGGKLDNSLDNYGGNAGSAGLGAGAGAAAASGLSHGHGDSHQHGSSGLGGEPVSGAYEGGSAGDALTGQSHAQRTGAGVGPLGENTHPHSSSTGTGRSEQVSGQGAAAVGGAGIAGAAGATALGSGATGHHHGTGVGAEGGSGGHYSSSGVQGSAPGGERNTNAGALAGGAAGAGALGAGAAGASGADSDNKTGKYGTVEKDFDRGAPVSDPKDLDTGGPHSLVFQESTGKYVHRRELEGKK